MPQTIEQLIDELRAAILQRYKDAMQQVELLEAHLLPDDPVHTERRAPIRDIPPAAPEPDGQQPAPGPEPECGRRFAVPDPTLAASESARSCRVDTTDAL